MLDVVSAGNLAHAEGGEVVSPPLDIDESAVPVFIAQACNEGSDRSFGCIGYSPEF